MRTRRKRRGHQLKKINLIRLLKVAGFLLLTGYVAVTAINLQVKIAANVRETRAYEQKTAAALQEKAQWEEELRHIDDDDYLEEKAREKGFVKPNERVFVDANKAK